LDPDGSVIIAGSFLRQGTTGLFCLARLSSSGALDESFAIGIRAGLVYGIAVQPDGKIVAVGDFSTVFDQTIRFVTRFHADGTLDAGFSSPATGDWGVIRAVALQRNGRIVLSKSFATARLLSDGSTDPSYSAATHPDWDTRAIAIGRNEKIWVAGGISSVNGLPTMGIARLHGDVSTFPGWQAKHFSPQELANPEISGEGGNAAGDGMPNLLKYALGADPRQSAVGLLPTVAVSSQGGDRFCDFTFRRNLLAVDLSYEVGVSHDLESWDDSGAKLDQVGPAVPAGDGLADYLTVRYRGSVDHAGKLFFRLSALRSEAPANRP
jgi:uncharacterized delta-60 repeat protein